MSSPKFRVILATAAILFSTRLTAQYWNTVGTVNHVLRNNVFDGPQLINEVQFLTNGNTRMRILDTGRFSVNPVSGTIIGTSHQMQYATMQIQGGNFSGLASYTAQTGDWGQNIQSYVTRANTVSFVVSLWGTDRFYVAGQGWVYANGAYFGSDRNLKTDIHTIPDALDRVLRLEGVSYRWKPLPPCKECPDGTRPEIDDRTEIGLIAQDVEKVVPEVVRTVADGTKAVAYQNLVALLVESIKTQQDQLDKQARALETLENQVRALQRRP